MGRKGSALLVVLGMLAFMVMSATAFSIYMRQNRLPSSFLRQRIAASLLVKASLTEAMSEIDGALGDDPYPNEYQLSEDGEGGGFTFGSSSTGNYWRNRVYLGASAAEGIDERVTASTLTLEGLAYLPPPLINTVRYWSRRSPAAQWRYLSYDSGRWAFTAVNVSDYLDINRLRADAMRDSSPTNRINLAYRFEDTNHTTFDSAKAKRFDSLIESLRNSACGPLVSLADYNMTMRQEGLFKSPFCDYIANAAGKMRPFYGGTAEEARQQTFVTDSWNPFIATNAATLALSDFANDAFFLDNGGSEIEPSLDALQKFAKPNTPYDRIQRRLSLVTLGALYDYVDEDSVPISLAIPTLERTPMLTGLQIVPAGFKVRFTHHEKKDDPVTAGGVTTTWTHHYWEFDNLDGTILANLCAVYPFKRSSGRDPGSFTAQVIVKGFLTDSPDEFEKFRQTADFRPTAEEWKGGKNRKFDSDGFFTAYGSKEVTGIKTSAKTPQETLLDIPAVELELKLDQPDKRKIFAFKVASKEKDGVVTEGKPEDDTEYIGTVPFAYMGADGKAKPVPEKSISGSANPVELKLVLLAWARLVDGEGNTVDLAPATFADDKDLNGVDHKLSPGGDLFGKMCGDDYPAFSVVNDKVGGAVSTAVFTEKGENVEFAGEMEPLALYCNDPRYNFAPEDWYVTEAEAGVKATDWLNNTSGGDLSDKDIFQFVSDCGYLQSVGELQFLPYTGAFGGDGQNFNPVSSDYYNSGKYNGQRRQKGNLANNSYMWRTHWAFGSNRDSANDMYDWDIVDTRGGMGVPPFSANLELFMGALANTPYDWAVADPFNAYKASDIDTYCFNSRNGEAKIEWEDLEEIARRMREKFRSTRRGPEDWWRWGEWDASEFFGVLGPDDGIHDVDRKFLYSYWRNCFSCNQQLFLLFVRAEPTMMMGSGNDDHTPAQLGGRAVALVWREPKSSIVSSSSKKTGQTSVGTHRMRVLFYHQFD